MIRFKVVRASKLMLIFSIVVLLAAIGIIAYVTANDHRQQSVSANWVNLYPAAKTQTVFAASLSQGEAQSVYAPLEVEILPVESIVDNEKNIRVLIYHTHTHEAYEQVSEDPYVAVEAWRTTDESHSVVRVGKALAEALRGYGFEVVHDTTDHEGNVLSTAYTRSLKTLENYSSDFDLYIDLHRDAYYDGLDMRFTGTDGVDRAQLMMLIGNGNGFEEKPYYTENNLFARKLTQRINNAYPGLCRDVMVKDGRYNQHIGVFSVLIEVGHNLNTLEEALNAVKPLAKGIYDLMADNPDLQLQMMKAEQS